METLEEESAGSEHAETGLSANAGNSNEEGQSAQLERGSEEFDAQEKVSEIRAALNELAQGLALELSEKFKGKEIAILKNQFAKNANNSRYGMMAKLLREKLADSPADNEIPAAHSDDEIRQAWRSMQDPFGARVAEICSEQNFLGDDAESYAERIKSLMEASRATRNDGYKTIVDVYLSKFKVKLSKLV